MQISLKKHVQQAQSSHKPQVRIGTTGQGHFHIPWKCIEFQDDVPSLEFLSCKLGTPPYLETNVQGHGIVSRGIHHCAFVVYELGFAKTYLD